MRVYEPGQGDKLHLDRDCDDIENGRRSAIAQGYSTHPVNEVDIDPLGDVRAQRFCVTCLKRNRPLLAVEQIFAASQLQTNGPRRFYLGDIEISERLYHELRRVVGAHG